MRDSQEDVCEIFQDEVRPAQPTAAPPGSPEKIAVLAQRVERLETVNHEGDNQQQLLPPSPRRICCWCGEEFIAKTMRQKPVCCSQHCAKKREHYFRRLTGQKCGGKGKKP